MHHLAAALVLALGLPAHAATIVLDFQEEEPGQRLNFFTSVECGGCVTFWHSDDPDETHLLGFDSGRALHVGEDEDHGGLHMAFALPLTSLGLDFGGDWPVSVQGNREVSNVGSVGWLRAYAGDELVGEAVVLANLNGLVDQRIALASATPFDRADFVLATGSTPRSGIGADEIVDNIVLGTVPEPGTLGLILLGAAAAMARCTRG